jgi:glutathione S-transferase
MLTFYFHPLSSFCQKALIALYENDTPFKPVIVNFFDEASGAAFKKLWPIGRFPVLHDESRDRLVPESSIIIEYLDQHYPGRTRFIPSDPERAREMRFHDRFFDLYANVPMQKIVTDRLRPAGKNDRYGVEQARKLLGTTLDLIEKAIAGKQWAMGEEFTMADCAAAPPLFFANKVMPFGETHPHAAAYLQRLMQRPSFARAVREAEPYLQMVPKENA